LALAFLATLFLPCSSLIADDAAVTLGLSSSDAARDASSARKGVLPTHAGLQLTIKADCANVQIFTDALDSVSYAVRPDPRAAGANPDSWQDFPLTVRNTSRGVMLIGQNRRGLDCRGDMIYEIHLPHRYDLDIAVRSGNIVTQDIDGLVAFSTGGGEIRTGSIGTSDAADKALANVAFVARLETAGGDICVGNVAGGLRAATAGGQISTGDVHGPAVLRTGGGDIHVGHVFGAARFTSGGGNITVEKVDGGVWADTAGGRVEIGSLARLAALARQLPARGQDTFPTDVPRRPGEQRALPAIADSDVTELARLFDVFLWGGIRVNPADQQKRLVNSIAPEYPDVARLAGIEGDVTLRIFIGRDGTIRGLTPVSGPPVLARAAMRAVEQWRYAPTLVDGHPVDVFTTVTLAFFLHP
jgi:TonB family protein